MSNRGIFDLSGKVAIVVGGASGIGEAVTIGAVAQGARVVCLDVKEAEAKSVAARAAADAGVDASMCEAGTLDIRDGAAVKASFADVRARLGSLDIVICTPSINVRKPILKYSEEELDRVLAVNIKGNFNVLQAAGAIMTEQKRGSIVLVLVGAIAGRRTGAGCLRGDEGGDSAAARKRRRRNSVRTACGSTASVRA